METILTDKEKQRRLKISQKLIGRKKPPFTKEHRLRLSLAGIGRIPSNKGKIDLGRRRETLKRVKQRYFQTPKGIYLISKGNAKRKNIPIMTQDEFISWHQSQNKLCTYCGISENGKRMTIDRKNNTLGYVIGNLVLACDPCNSLKSDILSFDEMLIVGEIIMKKRWKK